MKLITLNKRHEPGGKVEWVRRGRGGARKDSKVGSYSSSFLEMTGDTFCTLRMSQALTLGLRSSGTLRSADW
jgi:hypothetical protein